MKRFVFVLTAFFFSTLCFAQFSVPKSVTTPDTLLICSATYKPQTDYKSYNVEFKELPCRYIQETGEYFIIAGVKYKKEYVANGKEIAENNNAFTYKIEQGKHKMRWPYIRKKVTYIDGEEAIIEISVEEYTFSCLNKDFLRQELRTCYSSEEQFKFIMGFFDMYGSDVPFHRIEKKYSSEDMLPALKLLAERSLGGLIE